MKQIKTYTLQICNFTFIIELLAKKVLIKYKSHNYSAVQMHGLMVKLSVSQAMPNCMCGFESYLGQLFSFCKVKVVNMF